MAQDRIVYSPTPIERENIKPKEGMLKISGDGVFATLQGEGATAGEKAVFVRLHYCNLSCGKTSGWQCDTGYTWDKNRAEYWQEPEDWSFDTAAANIQSAWTDKFGIEASTRLVVTGGEPLLQQDKVIELISRLPRWNVEIETNGTIEPVDELAQCQINCSPKLANSGNSKVRRYKPDALRRINSFSNSWFKFVAQRPEDLAEIDQICIDCDLNPSKILVMPEGQTLSEVEQHADILRSAVEEKGWKLAMRNQFIWFGAKRRT